MRTTSPVDTLAERLRASIARTNRRLRQEADSGLSPTLSAALVTVGHHGPLTPSELAARERIKRPTATRLVAALEAQDLVERAVDPGDRRSSLISLSPAGRALLAATRDRKDVFLVRRLEALPAADRAVLEAAAGVLERLLEDPE